MSAPLNIGMNHMPDKRKYPRKPYVEEITVHINSNEYDESLLSKTVLCETLDISEGGIQLKTAEELSIGLEIELWIKIANRPGKFLLSGQVTWVKIQEQDKCFSAGVVLREKAHTGLSQWQALFN